ncbi:hypothetical protein M0R45_009379 [Rubus argutus]|uniref:ADP-ribosyl cyclase/cyclic ADP-ribose hydrolase n=1 Tax=Rubus argutus TaxID=59490 RepID=A0AAW1Y7A6_RUBAR
MATYTSSFSFYSAATRRRHDVFLSFRGEDTRYGITKNLHEALVDAGIPTFKDDVNLQKGGEIATDLLKAIQMSRIAIIVFSENYASSSWCLDELVKIVECKREAGQVILPIFCDVDPCDVQQQIGSFSQALGVHEMSGRTQDKLEAWRASLTEAAGQPDGFDMQDAATWLQSKFIKEIVKHVLSRYQDAHLSVSIFPPRLDAGIEVIETQFQQNLQMIKDMEETIRRSYVQAHDRERSLIAEIEAIRRQNNAEAQIIAALQKNLNSSFPLNALDLASDVLLDGKGPGNFEGLGDYRALLGFVTEKEMIIGDASVNDELKAKMHFLNVGSKDLKEAVSSIMNHPSRHSLSAGLSTNV